MTDHIIKAAREAGFVNQYPTVPLLEVFERFYAIAYRAGMERAAEICEEEALRFEPSRDFSLCIAAIRAHAKNQPKNGHDSSVVGGREEV